MTELTSLEAAVLRAFVDELDSPLKEKLAQQIADASVASRKNTGGGFYTDFEIGNGPHNPLPDLKDRTVVGRVDGLQLGMGFVLWVKDGRLACLEGYSYGGEGTAHLTLEAVKFELIDWRKDSLS
jgi:hypothetical protein